MKHNDFGWHVSVSPLHSHTLTLTLIVTIWTISFFPIWGLQSKSRNMQIKTSKKQEFQNPSLHYCFQSTCFKNKFQPNFASYATNYAPVSNMSKFVAT